MPDRTPRLSDTRGMIRTSRRRVAWITANVGLLALIAPAPALAADPPLVEGAGGSATLLVILLLGSLTAGLFFASPLRRRLTDGPPGSTDQAQPNRSMATSRVGHGLRPVGSVVTRGQAAADAVLDAVGERIAAQGRRLGGTSPARPLPPMLGGDIFFEDEPPAVEADPPGNDQPVGPWSTAPLSEDALRRPRLRRSDGVDSPGSPRD